jgi:hypothetical protein
MSQGFPKFTPSARSGETGSNLVTRIVSDDLHWMFSRNHQESDFGIDGVINVVTDSDHVTGQFFGVQIKYGKSFFQEKNRWGYVYRGDQKHFNYLCNYSAPILILLCHPESGDCYWMNFDADKVESTDKAWKITIPFNNKLHTSKSALLNLIGPPVDQLEASQKSQIEREVITMSDRVLYCIERCDVNASNVANVRTFFDRLVSTQDTAYRMQGKIELSFSGYDLDKRELFEIPEIVRYVGLVDKAIPEILFFSALGDYSGGLKAIVLALCDGKVVGKKPAFNETAQVQYNVILFRQFLLRSLLKMNELATWLNLSSQEKGVVIDTIFGYLRLDKKDYEYELNVGL